GPCRPGVPRRLWTARPPRTAGSPAVRLLLRGGHGTLPPPGRDRRLNAHCPPVRPRGPATGPLLVGRGRRPTRAVSPPRGPTWANRGLTLRRRFPADHPAARSPAAHSRPASDAEAFP